EGVQPREPAPGPPGEACADLVRREGGMAGGGGGACLIWQMLVEPGPAMDEQDARLPAALRIAPAEHAGERGLPVPIRQGPGGNSHMCVANHTAKHYQLFKRLYQR